jgi:hypothetical protein
MTTPEPPKGGRPDDMPNRKTARSIVREAITESKVAPDFVDAETILMDAIEHALDEKDREWKAAANFAVDDSTQRYEAELKERDATIASLKEIAKAHALTFPEIQFMFEDTFKEKEQTIASLRLEVETLNVMLKELVAKDYDKILDYCDSGLQMELSALKQQSAADIADAKEKMGKIREYAQHTEECCWGGMTADNKFNVECSCGLAALYQERHGGRGV